MSKLTTTREERGLRIAELSGQINRVDDYLYVVKSQSHNGEYAVNQINNEWFCDCPDNKYRHVKCKHIYAVEFSFKLKQAVKVNRVIQEVTVSECVTAIQPILRSLLFDITSQGIFSVSPVLIAVKPLASTLVLSV